MNDRLPFESRSDDYSSQPVHTNRILRFEPGVSPAFADVAPLFPPTELPDVEIAHRICLPEGYTPGYSYPLLVWLHGDGGSAEEIDEILPRISERNYIAVAVQGNVAQENGHAWSVAEDRLSALLSDVRDLTAAMQDRFRIHSDRVYLAGFGTGGTLAWEILLRQPSEWTGAICLSGRFPEMKHPLAMFRQLQQRRLLVSTGLDRPAQNVNDLVNSGRLMYSAGMEVGTRLYERGCQSPTDKMLRDVDRWVMDSIATAIR